MGALALLMPGQPNEEFRKVAERVKRGRSLRELSRLTGISHTRISDMLFGVVPSFRLLERFVQEVGLSADEKDALFAAAGYPSPDPVNDDLSGHDVYWLESGRAYEQLRAEGISFNVRQPAMDSEWWESLTPEDARAEVQRQVEEARERPREGGSDGRLKPDGLPGRGSSPPLAGSSE